PVFDPDNRLLGVIAMSGDASQVHPHTLGMVITAARAIENQLRIQKASKELVLRNNYMRAIIDSIDSGVMAIDKNGIINQINNQGRHILKWGIPLEGKPLSTVLGNRLNLARMMRPGFELVDQEIIIHSPTRDVHLLYTAKPIFDQTDEMQGIIIVFNEIHRIRKLVNEMAGTHARFTFEDIIGVSSTIQEVKRMAMIAALGNSTVLLLGETGTGKELFAQAIHNHSERRGHPFLAINCGAIPRELLESELFGYADGAFTGARKGGRPGKFELANGGTILLDEIGDMPADMQVKMLRVLQTGEVYRIGGHKSMSVDVRIIAATHAKLQEKVDQKIFREDLFYRLNVLPIVIPPLRLREEDIIPLARHILHRCAQSLNKPGLTFTSAAEQALLAYSWPGNIRELENVVERAVNMAAGGRIEPFNLGITVATRSVTAKMPRRAHLEEIEKETIADIIAEMGYNLSKAARTLGISRATLYNKIKKYGLALDRASA
ncbi:MAG: sigma-54 interaction domain-containing protein, partial [Desulfobacterales bacterium]